MKVPQMREHYCTGLNLDCCQNPKNMMWDDLLWLISRLQGASQPWHCWRCEPPEGQRAQYTAEGSTALWPHFKSWKHNSMSVKMTCASTAQKWSLTLLHSLWNQLLFLSITYNIFLKFLYSILAILPLLLITTRINNRIPKYSTASKWYSLFF
jgi:hypothetical protein